MKNMFDGSKLMDRFFKKVDGVEWDLMSGKIGIRTADGITTIEGEGKDAEVIVNMIDSFSMPIPAFAQNTPIDSVKLGDLIYGNGITGWVIKKAGNKFTVLKPNGTNTTWQAPKAKMMGMDGLNGVMILRSLVNATGGNDGLSSIQGMLLPMMMMGGDSMDLDSIMPMMLMSQSTGAVDAEGNANPMNGMMNGNMMQTMMMMQMMKGSNSSRPSNPGTFFNRSRI